MSADQRQLLVDALDRARTLLGKIEYQAAELEASSALSSLSAQQLDVGREAMSRAVAAAKRTVGSLEAALAQLSANDATASPDDRDASAR